MRKNINTLLDEACKQIKNMKVVRIEDKTFEDAMFYLSAYVPKQSKGQLVWIFDEKKKEAPRG